MGLSLLLTLASAACDDFGFEGFLNQPIPIRVQAGVPLVDVAYQQGARRTAVIDSGSPLTVIHDKSQVFKLPADGLVGGQQLLLGLGRSTGELRLQDGAVPDVTRFIFHNLEVVDAPLQPLGLGESITVQGLLGATLLTHFAVHLRYAPAQLILRDAVSDSEDELASDCKMADLLVAGGFERQRCTAVFQTPLNGGGTVLLGNAELQLAASRLTVELCVGADEFDPTQPRPQLPTTSGLPISAVIATGLGASVISRSAYERLRLHLPALKETGRQTLHLQTGSLQVSTVEIPRVAIVSDRTLDLGPCGELARRRRLLLAPTLGIDPRDSGHEGSAVASTVEAVTFAVVADEAGLLQGLRQELRSIVADVDVVLGGSFLSAFEFDLDYPNGRTIMQCAEGLDGERCRVLPRCTQAGGIADCPTRKP